jgi:lipopolysaccharide export LptBFGC system permease protein LptF
MLTVFVVGTFIFTFRDVILPSIVREANEISLLIKPRGGKPVTIILTDEENGTINTYMMGHFDSLKKVAYNFRLEKRKIEDWRQGKTNIYEVYTDDKATLDGDTWRFGMNPRHYLKGYYEERELPIGNIKTAITPAMLEQQSLGLAVMTSSELSAFPNDVTKMIELAQRRAAPFASVVIMLVAASFILHRERENPGSAVGRVKSIVMALLICAGFYLVQGIFVSFAEAEWIGPNLASWAPNIVFGIWGGHAFRHVNL